MIDWLEIRQFAIAEHIEIEFDDRFTTVTGETGSGKSLIVDAIDILTGHRSDVSYIKHDHDSAELQAGFVLAHEHPAHCWLNQQGVDNDGEVIVRRILRRNRPSKGYINGHAVTVSQLKELGSYLIDIHGQNEHHSLLQRRVQLELLDNAADNGKMTGKLVTSYIRISQIQSQIETLNDQSHSSQERADMLKFQIEELSELGPQPHEWQELEMDHMRSLHQQELVGGTQEVADGLYQSDSSNLSSQLLQNISQLDQLSAYAPELKDVCKMLNEAQVNIEEAAKQLQPLYQDSALDPAEIEILETRVSLYHSLARKHRTQPRDLAAHLDQLKQELEGLADPETEIIRLTAELESEVKRYRSTASKISSNRTETAKILSLDVTAVMQELGMKGGEFEIRLVPVEDTEFTRYGMESAEYAVTANPGLPLQPLGKVASGGELSRISLAIQVVLAGTSVVPTLIFDEVDVGIGGEVANVVGEKLRKLGETSQVICVTHLSQVAARGNHQFSVSKNLGKQAQTRVVKLDPDQRIEEIARMTGGENITEQSLAHAEEMLKQA
jgi:DNA repair protein RecN (Recombination protein N)